MNAFVAADNMKRRDMESFLLVRSGVELSRKRAA
jgi:hypothetical protein